MKRYKFEATLIKDDERTGYKRGWTIKPKGFYYQKKEIILVGSITTGSTTRISFPVDIVNMSVIEEDELLK